MAAILDVNFFVPNEKISNEYISQKFPKWTAENIFLKTGIKNRGKAPDNITAGDLAVQASKKLFSNNTISKNEIDYLIFVTQTPLIAAPQNMFYC